MPKDVPIATGKAPGISPLCNHLLLGRETRKKKRICILTHDIFGPIRNGGIGTAYFHVAVFLKRNGHDVTICFVNGQANNLEKMRRNRNFYAQYGIEFNSIAPKPGAKTEMAVVMAGPYAAYDWLRREESNFDIIHVSEWHGLGYVSLLAKSLGIAFGAMHFVVKGSSPTVWAAEGNQQFLKSERELGWVFMEKRSAELADTLICGSSHLMTWMKNNQYQLPKNSYFWPNIFLDDLAAGELKTPRSNSETLYRGDITEWVFFGRLEPRKGLLLFIDTLNYLAEKNLKIPKVTFLGGESVRFDAKSFIRAHQDKWKTDVQIESSRNSAQALKYLSQEGRLAVIPALLENSPIAVYECLALSIPFLAADTGGTSELIAEEDREKVVFAPNHLALARKLAHARDGKWPLAKKHERLDRSLEIWREWHDKLAIDPAKPMAQQHTPPLVSICLTHFERPRHLLQAIASIKSQTYEKIEVILVDDGSSNDASRAALSRLKPDFEARGWQIVVQENQYVGAARNTAAKRAKGKFLLFFDDDNVMAPDMVEKLTSAAIYADLDCLTCSAIRFLGPNGPFVKDSKIGSQIRFVGPAKAWSAITNVVGDATCLIRATVFSEIGGYTEQYKVGKDDIELYNKLIRLGKKISYYPDPLYYYRQGGRSMKSRNHLEESGQFRMLKPKLHGLDSEEKSSILYFKKPKLKRPENHKPSKQKTIFQKIRKFVRVF